MPYVDRDPVTGRITDEFGNPQREGHEFLAPDAFEFQQKAKRNAIDAAYVAAVARGWPYGQGDAIQIGEAHRINISGLGANAGFFLASVPGFTWPAGGQFLRTSKDVNLYLTPQQFVVIAMGVRECWSNIRERYAALKDACAAAQNLADLAAIDPVAGWPN